MRKQSRILAAVLCLTLVFTLFAGCGKTENQSGDKSTGETQAKQTGTAGEKTQQEVQAQPVEIGFTFWEAGWDGPEEGKDVVAPEIEKRTGVKIKLEHWKVTSEEEQKRQLGLWASSGDIPDVLFVPSDGYTIDLLNQMGETNQIWDIKDYIGKLSDESIRNLALSSASFYSNKKNGGYYFYPTQCNDYKAVAETDNAQEGVIIRKDWLDKLGLSYPQNPEEYYNVLKEFKTRIKDVNGQPVIPLLLGENFSMNHEIMKWFFDKNDRFDDYRFFRNENGQLTNAPIMPKLEAFAVFMNKLYREGLLDQEFATLKDSQYQERMNSGRVGSSGQVWWNMTSYNDNLQKTDPNAMYVFMPMPKGAGVSQPVQQYITAGAPGGFIISKKLDEKKMDALFKLFDYMSTKEGVVLGMYGLENVHWKYNAENKIEVTQEFLDRTKGDWNMGAHEGVGYYAGMGVSLSIIGDLLAPSPTSKRADIIESRKNLAGTIFSATEPQDLVPPGPVENKKMAGIRQAWRDLIIKAVLAPSEDECKKIINTWADTFVKLGGEDVIKEKNELAAAK